MLLAAVLAWLWWWSLPALFLLLFRLWVSQRLLRRKRLHKKLASASNSKQQATRNRLSSTRTTKAGRREEGV